MQQPGLAQTDTEQVFSVRELADGDDTGGDTEFVSLDISELQSGLQSGIIGNQSAAADNKTKEEQLKAKEAELNEKEKRLKEVYGDFPREDLSSLNAKSENEKELNWPHPRCAYVYHDIDCEIPEEVRHLVRAAYTTWKLTALGYILNMATILLAAFHDGYYASAMEKSEAMFTSLLWVGVAIPMSFLLWYMNLYRIAQAFSTKNWLVFCVAFACHMAFAAIILSGCPWYPCAGVFFTLTCFFSGLTVSTCFGVMNCTVWCLVLTLSVWIFGSVRRMFSGNQSDSAEEVKGEFQNTVAKIVAIAM